MEKNWVPFFPAKIRVFLGSILKNLTKKEGNTGIGYHKNDKNVCSTSFLMVLESGNPNFDARILSVQNLMSIILFIL